MGYRKSATVLLCLAVVLPTVSSFAAEPVEKWEYAELRDGRIPPGKGQVQGQDRMRRISWITGDEVVIGDDWDTIAEKLKAQSIDQKLLNDENLVENSVLKRIRVLNHLGKQGWELSPSESTTNSVTVRTWTFKRRLQN